MIEYSTSTSYRQYCHHLYVNLAYTCSGHPSGESILYPVITLVSMTALPRSLYGSSPACVHEWEVTLMVQSIDENRLYQICMPVFPDSTHPSLLSTCVLHAACLCICINKLFVVCVCVIHLNQQSTHSYYPILCVCVCVCVCVCACACACVSVCVTSVCEVFVYCIYLYNPACTDMQSMCA